MSCVLLRADPSFGDRDPDRSLASPLPRLPDPKAIRRELGTVLLQWAPAGELDRIVGILPMAQQTGRWHHLYNTRRWQRRAKLQLTEFPLCAMCLARKVTTPATVADHITPHHGDPQLFYFGELQSLCAHCHSSRKKQLESYGYQLDVGPDGWPIDPNHPANKPSPQRRTR